MNCGETRGRGCHHRGITQTPSQCQPPLHSPHGSKPAPASPLLNTQPRFPGSVCLGITRRTRSQHNAHGVLPPSPPSLSALRLPLHAVPCPRSFRLGPPRRAFPLGPCPLASLRGLPWSPNAVGVFCHVARIFPPFIIIIRFLITYFFARFLIARLPPRLDF